MKHSDIEWSKLINFAKGMLGKPYNFGAEVDIPSFIKDPNPSRIKSIDCSELIQVGFALIGLNGMPDGSYNQFKVCNPVDSHKVLVGDLGFKWNPDTHVIHHVGVYVGDNTLIEAKGIAYGVIETPKTLYEDSLHFARWGRFKQIQDA